MPAPSNSRPPACRARPPTATHTAISIEFAGRDLRKVDDADLGTYKAPASLHSIADSVQMKSFGSGLQPMNMTRLPGVADRRQHAAEARAHQVAPEHQAGDQQGRRERGTCHPHPGRGCRSRGMRLKSVKLLLPPKPVSLQRKNSSIAA